MTPRTIKEEKMTKHKITIDIWANFRHADKLVEILNETDGVEASLGHTLRQGKRDIQLKLDPEKVELDEHFQ